MRIFGLLSIVSTCIQVVKETFSTTIPAENWENYDLYHQDMMNGMPVEERMKNVRNGKYKITETYPEPHRDSVTGKIIIENTLLYNEDVKNYGAYQAYQWMQQGKYNLSPEDLKKEEERIKKHFDYLFSL
ncbi:MAG: hypothetical protein J6C42_08555 [Clostridia bacterium]|nr:hypothetical protein [Clostridia bacterium]